MNHPRICLLLLLISTLFSAGCLERRIFVRWDGNHPPELMLFWNGDSADAMTGSLPGYDAPDWALHSPRRTQDDKEGTFSQTGIWKGAPFGSKYQAVSQPSPITPRLAFHTYYLGVVRLHVINGTIPGASFLPFPDPEKGIPPNPVDSLKKLKFPFTGETQDRLEKEHDRNVLEFYKIMVSEMFARLHDSLYTGDDIKGKKWGDTISERWFRTLKLDEPATNDLDFFKYADDTLLPALLPPDKVAHGLVVSAALKKVYDTYRDLEDEDMVISLNITGKVISANNDSTRGDTLFWKWDGKKLRSGGPYTMTVKTVKWDPVGCLIITVILMLFPLYRLSRRRALR